MIEHVVTLPITPKKNARFETLLAPLVANLIAKYLDANLILATNLTGKRFSKNSKKEIFALQKTYENRFDTLGIKDYRIWNEYVSGFKEYLFEIISALEKEKIVFEKHAELFHCPCGAVNIQEQALVSSFGKSLIKKQDGEYLCFACDKKISKTNERCLFFKREMLSGDESLFPKCVPYTFRKELNDLAKKLNGRSLLISKKKFHGTEWVSLIGNKYNLDPDFVWNMYLVYLSHKDHVQNYKLITGSRVLWQAARVGALSKVLAPELQIEPLIYPTVDFKDSAGKIKTVTAENFLKEFTQFSRRSYLAAGLAWGRKSAQVNSRILFLAAETEKNLKDIPLIPKPTELRHTEDFIRVCNGNKVLSLLSMIRKSKTLDNEQKLLLDLLKA